MSVYRLIWELIKHAAHGRGRDQVYLLVYDGDDSFHSLSGEITDFSWEMDQDKFCTLMASDGSTS